MNRVFLMGNLTRDPELRSTSSGMPIAVGGIAIKDGEKVFFLDYTIWDKRAAPFVEHHKKGQKAFFEGKLTEDKWKDKDGNEKSRLKISVSNWEFVS